jgi:hypothetical protein
MMRSRSVSRPSGRWPPTSRSAPRSGAVWVSRCLMRMRCLPPPANSGMWSATVSSGASKCCSQAQATARVAASFEIENQGTQCSLVSGWPAGVWPRAMSAMVWPWWTTCRVAPLVALSARTCVNAEVVRGRSVMVADGRSRPVTRRSSGPTGLVISAGGTGASGALVGSVTGAVHVHVVAGVDQPVEQGLGDHGVGEQRIPVHRVAIEGQDQ